MSYNIYCKIVHIYIYVAENSIVCAFLRIRNQMFHFRSRNNLDRKMVLQL